MKLEFSWQFSKNAQISKFMQIRPVGVKLFRADRWMDMVKQIVAFSSFANSPKKCSGSYWQACSSFLLGQIMWILWKTKWHWAMLYF
jgi:hypothetical protein